MNSRGDVAGLLGGVLIASGPHPASASKMQLFGQFVGSWRLRWHLINAAAEVEVEGELHFGWVLDGRAVQDVWIVPGRGRHGADLPPHGLHGSTIRFYDDAIDAWRSTWVEPINGRVRKFIGRPTPDGIRLLSHDDTPALRWSFTDIKPESFTWTGEYLDDDRGWVVEERMAAERVDGRSRFA
jgi:hypothetical protein